MSTAERMMPLGIAAAAAAAAAGSGTGQPHLQAAENDTHCTVQAN